MEDISNINLGGISYSIKDTTARGYLIKNADSTTGPDEYIENLKLANDSIVNLPFKMADKDNAGMMTASDKAKLDSLSGTTSSASASGSYTPEGTVDISTTKEEGNDLYIGPTGITGNMQRTLTSESQFSDVQIAPVGGTTTVNSITSVGTLPNLGTPFTVPNITSVGSAPTLGTPFTVYSITSLGSLPTYSSVSIPNIKSVGTMFSASVNGETLILTPGKAPTLGTKISVNSITDVGALPSRSSVKIPNITSVGSAPTLGTSFAIPNVTGIGSLPQYSSKTVATAGSTVIASKLTTIPESDRVSLGSHISASFIGTQKDVHVYSNASNDMTGQNDMT